MPRVAVAEAAGGPEVLKLVEAQLDAAGPEEVRIEVRAAGVNPIDWKLYSPERGATASYPMRIGFEVAGVISEAGAQALGPAGPLKVGDEVIAYRVNGGYAEELVCPASACVPRPPSSSWEQAGALMLAGATAVHALQRDRRGRGRDRARPWRSRRRRPDGGSARPRARRKVIATASERNHEYLRRLGAEPVLYGSGLAERVRALGGDALDAAIDCVGSREALQVSLQLVADRERIATIVVSPGAPRRESSCSAADPGPTRHRDSRRRAPAARQPAGSGQARDSHTVVPARAGGGGAPRGTGRSRQRQARADSRPRLGTPGAASNRKRERRDSNPRPLP